MVQLPALTPVATPLPSTVATAGLLEDHVTDPETLPVVPSEKVPVAVKVVIAPGAIETVGGATVRLFSVAAVTVMAPVPDVTPYTVPLFTDAVIVAVPIVLPVTTPGLATLAVPGAADDQLTDVEMSAVVPFP